MLRWSIPIGLIVVGFVSIGVIIIARPDPTGFSILVGLASTVIASGLVDLSGLAVRRRQLKPLRELAARRMARLHRELLTVVHTMFSDLSVDPPTAWPQVLRAAADRPIDLTEPADVVPPRTKADWLRQLRAQIDLTLDELRTLSSAGAYSDDINDLDRLLPGPFLSGVDAGVSYLKFRNRAVLLTQAADLLEQVQARLPVVKKPRKTRKTKKS